MLNSIKSYIKNTKWFYIKALCLLLLLTYLLPYLLLGQNAHVWTHDNLDSVLIYNKVLAESGNIFSPNNTIIPNILNGLPRSCYGSEFSFTLWLYYFFNAFTAYTFNLIFLHVVAFIGAVLLLRKHVFFKNEDNIYIYPIALCFALMPFWSPAALSVAGQPLLLYAFLNIRNKNYSYLDWLIIILFPFFSSLVFSGLFFVVFMSILLLYDIIKSKKINWPFFLSITIITIGYLLVDYRLLLSFFVAPDFISHRVEFNLHKEALDFKAVVYKGFNAFLDAQYHANSIHYPFILVIALLAITTGWMFKIKGTLNILKLLLIAMSIMLFYKFLEMGKILELSKKSQFLNTFQINRFYTLFPLLWLLILGFSFFIIYQLQKRYIKYIFFLLLICQISFSFYSSYSFRYSFNDVVLHSKDIPRQFPRYNDFYSENSFNIIKKGIAQPLSSYHVINVGIDPAITAYNGFYTLDMYVANYPLSYKHQFREVIKMELDKNADKRKYFDTWGSRCYVFAAEQDSLEINHLDLNFNILKQMDCRFLFSAKKINNADKNLKFIHRLIGNQTLKFIYIYKLI